MYILKMSSTRNKNSLGNYTLQQKSYTRGREYIDYENSYTGRAYQTALPAIGYNPSRMPGDNFSKNPVEIESFLFGINSTNLVEPNKPAIKPELKPLPTYSYFDRIAMRLPNPLVVEDRQRPLFE
jgi:hypothetical protein